MIKYSLFLYKSILSLLVCFVLFEALRNNFSVPSNHRGMKCLSKHRAAVEARNSDLPFKSPRLSQLCYRSSLLSPCMRAYVCVLRLSQHVLSSAGQKHLTRSVHFLLVNLQILYFYQRKRENSPGISLPQECAERGSRTRGRLHVLWSYS